MIVNISSSFKKVPFLQPGEIKKGNKNFNGHCDSPRNYQLLYLNGGIFDSILFLLPIMV